MLPENRKGLTITLDGKTIRSTGKMERYDSPLHIISAQISELGITFASKSEAGKSSEIPAVQQLIAELDLEGCMIVADALNCQKKTGEAVVKGKGDYLLAARGDQAAQEQEIRDYVQEESLRKTMDCKAVTEKSRVRIETRSAYTTADIDWLHGKEKWKNYAALAQSRRNLNGNGRKQKNGITISPAGSLPLWSCFIMPGWSGPWNPCTGLLTFIFRKITDVLSIEPFR